MPQSKYLTAPPLTDRMPRGIPYIIGNELAERFSFYGMKAILVAFMVKYLKDFSGNPAPMDEPTATAFYHAFVMSAYFFPIGGAIIADWWLGKYRTIIALSLVYCLGHVALSLDETRLGLAVGLALIALGAGGIKPCVSAHVGDQFGAKNQHLLTRVFGWFYFSINLGAAVSSLLTPVLLDRYGSQVAFGVPAVLMFLATLVFWMGRRKFVHIPPGGLGFLREAFSSEGLLVLGRLTLVFAFLAPFWALYDQTGSSWVLQAEHMSREIAIPGLPTWELLPAQVQAVNPFLILLFIPLFSYGIYPLMGLWIEPTPLRRIAIGLFLTAVAFMISAWIESRISLGQRPHILWQVLAYIVITAAEVLVWITGLEFSYTQAPPRMKSLVMALGLLSVAGGNALTAAINALIAWMKPAAGSGAAGLLTGAGYYWLFTYMMLATAIGFLFVLKFYRGRTYLQGEKT